MQFSFLSLTCFSQAYEIDETEPDGFDAGMEFHDENEGFVPRPPGKSWPKGLQEEMKYYEQALLTVYDEKSLLPPGFERFAHSF